MKLRFFILLWLLLAAGRVGAQVNYVLNPSFEEHSNCPNAGLFSPIAYANYWNTIDSIGWGNCMPNYFNTCGSPGIAGLPSWAYGYQYPRTDSGVAMVLFMTDFAHPPQDGWGGFICKGGFTSLLRQGSTTVSVSG
jgi:hypothetical protein